ncbi:hypothetical protein EXE49_16770, partial [Halorubrum sp. ASP121]
MEGQERSSSSADSFSGGPSSWSWSTVHGEPQQEQTTSAPRPSSQRTTRSQTVNQAIRADRCEQRAENEESGQVDAHGDRVRWRAA